MTRARHMIKRSCFCCGKQLVGAIDSNIEQEFTSPPDGATTWTTRGNYGSAVFDPGPPEVQRGRDERLEISICDDCLKTKANLVYRFVTTNRMSVSAVGIFNPNK